MHSLSQLSGGSRSLLCLPYRWGNRDSEKLKEWSEFTQSSLSHSGRVQSADKNISYEGVLLLLHMLPSKLGTPPTGQPSLLYCRRSNLTQQVSWEDERGVLRTSALLALFLFLKEASVFLCSSMSYIRTHTMQFCHLWLMGILPHSAFKMRKSTCRQIKATFSRVSSIRNKDEFWSPVTSQLVQSQVSDGERSDIYGAISNSRYLSIYI